MNVLYVGLGGAIGAVLRYLISLIPLKTQYPFLTLITNVIGAIVIGFIVGLISLNKLTKAQSMFLKTGLCGGFTTFSTFSLESLQLFEHGKIVAGSIYMGLSLVLCILGVIFGRYLALLIAKS